VKLYLPSFSRVGRRGSSRRNARDVRSTDLLQREGKKEETAFPSISGKKAFRLGHYHHGEKEGGGRESLFPGLKKEGISNPVAQMLAHFLSFFGCEERREKDLIVVLIFSRGKEGSS